MSTYTILSAGYANAQHTAAVIMTEEAAAVAVSELDTPDVWAEMLAWGEPKAYSPPVEPPAPTPLEKLSAFLGANPDVLRLVNGDGPQ